MYRVYNNQLYYADKSDLNNWVILCNKPNCGHPNSGGSSCSAYVPNGVCFSNDRIYYLVDASHKKDLYTGNKDGFILCSMAMDGTDDKLEYVWEETMNDQGGGTRTGLLTQTALIIGKQQLNKEGAWISQLFYADADGARCIYEGTDNAGDFHFVMSTNHYFGIGGDSTFCTDYFDIESEKYLSSITFVNNKQISTIDLSDLPYYGGYLFNGNLRIFRANDGYYDVDLDTMEEVKVCDAQFEISGAKILQANCILESNLFASNTWNYYAAGPGLNANPPHAGAGVLRLFNGQQWLDVELPEELINLPDDNGIDATTLTGEYIICTVRIDDVQRYYRIDLAAENLKLEYWFETK